MAVDPRIALGVQPIQIDNPLAQYGQIQNILAAQQQRQAAGTQQQVAQLSLGQLQRSADYVDKMQKAIADNGGPLDINQAAKMMATHPDPNIAMHGIELMKALQDKKTFEDYIKGQSPNALTTPAAAPAAAVPTAANTFGINNMGGMSPTNFTDQAAMAGNQPSLASAMPVAPQTPAADMTAAAPVTNALAPVAPTANNLPAATTPGAAQIAKLKQDIINYSLMQDPRAAKMAAQKEAELKTLMTPHVVGPSGTLTSAAGEVLYKAPAAPTNLAKMQAELDALPPNDPRRAEYVGMIQKETQFAPSHLAQLIKERDALQPGDPNRKVYDTEISKTQNEINNQRAHLKLAQDRFEQEFSMGKLSPGVIDMMANRYLIDSTLPPIGAGKKGAEAKSQILNRALEISGQKGATPAETAASVVQGKQDVKAQTATITDFASGEASRKVRSNNTALNHLATMDKLADDLANADTRVVNLAANAFAKATGSTPPTNFDAAKQLVANEVMKAVVANGGTGAEREEAGNSIKSSSSPQQLRGVINTYRELLGGQLSSLQLQYESGSGRKDFDKKLFPATRELLNKSAPATTPAPAGAVDTNNKWLK